MGLIIKSHPMISQPQKEEETDNFTLRDWARQWSFPWCLEKAALNMTFVPKATKLAGCDLESLARSYSVRLTTITGVESKLWHQESKKSSFPNHSCSLLPASQLGPISLSKSHLDEVFNSHFNFLSSDLLHLHRYSWSIYLWIPSEVLFFLHRFLDEAVLGL